MIIEVKEEDIIKSLQLRAEDKQRWSRRVCFSCPIAQSIRRDNPTFTDIRVGFDTATMVISGRARRVIFLPLIARRYTDIFDNWKKESYQGLRFETVGDMEVWIG